MTVTDEPGYRSAESLSHGPAATVTVTCCRDDRSHRVLDVELAAACSQPRGLVRAICGHVIAPASLVAPDGPPCLLCTAIRDAQR
ncbi:hypothetical protein [Pseudonocardia sp. DLS-67]